MKVDVNETDEYGYTGLHMAAENGFVEVVGLLLENGAGPNKLVFESLLTPLHLALSKVCLYALSKACLYAHSTTLCLVEGMSVCLHTHSSTPCLV